MSSGRRKLTEATEKVLKFVSKIFVFLNRKLDKTIFDTRTRHGKSKAKNTFLNKLHVMPYITYIRLQVYLILKHIILYAAVLYYSL